MKMGSEKNLEFFEMPTQKIEVSEYPYTYARVMAMKSRLFKRIEYERMMKLTLPEFIHFLQESDYRRQIEELALKYQNVELVERSVFLNLLHTYEKLKRISEDVVSRLFDFYMRRKEIELIKKILRAKNAGKFQEVIDEIEALPLKVSKTILDMEIDEIAEIMLPDNEERKEAVDYFRQTKSLSLIEAQLDKVYYTDLIGFSRAVKRDYPRFSAHILKEVESVNIKVVLRLRKLSVEDEIIGKNMTELREDYAEELIKKEPHELLSQLRKIYPKQFSGGVSKDDIASIESKVNIGLMESALNLLKSLPLSRDLVIGYLLAKEVETRNLAVIAKAKDMGLKDEEIYSMLVIR